MIFFKNPTLSNSPFYSAQVEEIHLADPHLVSSKMLRHRTSQVQAFTEYEGIATSHAFVLRPGKKGVRRLEVPSELKKIGDRSLENAHGDNPLHPYGEELSCEKFMLLYHEGEYERINALLIVPTSTLNRDLMAGNIEIAKALVEIADEPMSHSPLVLRDFRVWRDLCAVKVDRGHVGYPHIELPDVLFRTGYHLDEPCVTLWYDIGSSSLLMLKNSSIDAIGNTNLFGSDSDFVWEGLEDYQSKWRENHSQCNLEKLPMIPDPWRHRIRPMEGH